MPLRCSDVITFSQRTQGARRVALTITSRPDRGKDRAQFPRDGLAGATSRFALFVLRFLTARRKSLALPTGRESFAPVRDSLLRTEISLSRKKPLRRRIGANNGIAERKFDGFFPLRYSQTARGGSRVTNTRLVRRRLNEREDIRPPISVHTWRTRRTRRGRCTRTRAESANARDASRFRSLRLERSKLYIIVARQAAGILSREV